MSFTFCQGIRRVGDLKKKPVTRALDDEWKARIAGHWWATNYNKPESLTVEELEMLKLRDRLLLWGGSEVCMSFFEEHTQRLLNQGKVWEPKGLTLKKGAASGCHSNILKLHAANPDATLCAYGYGLSADGMWRSHSWCIQDGARVVETTTRRVLYYGFIYTEEEVAKRILENA